MKGRARIYMASPLGFSEAGRHFYNSVLVPFVASLGYHVLDPWTLTDPRKIEAVQRMPYGPKRRGARPQLQRRIGATHPAAVGGAHGGGAVLDRPDADSGSRAGARAR